MSGALGLDPRYFPTSVLISPWGIAASQGLVAEPPGQPRAEE
jgi:hypothetical protein